MPNFLIAVFVHLRRNDYLVYPIPCPILRYATKRYSFVNLRAKDIQLPLLSYVSRVYNLFFKGRMEYPDIHFRLVQKYSHGYFSISRTNLRPVGLSIFMRAVTSIMLIFKLYEQR